jgi:hypothetical protein
MSKDVAGVLSYKMVEPVPIRIGDAEAVFQKADSPYAALLWLEFVANPEAQKIIEAGYKGSVFSPGTRLFRWRGQGRFLWWTGVTIPRCKSICGWSWKRMVFPRPKPPANNSPEFSPNRAGARVTR